MGLRRDPALRDQLSVSDDELNVLLQYFSDAAAAQDKPSSAANGTGAWRSRRTPQGEQRVRTNSGFADPKDSTTIHHRFDKD